jgi:short-subunit dehydrogenase
MSIEVIVITGASSGIGEGFARAFAGEGKALLLVARREERLRKLAEEFKGKAEIHVLAEDLNDPEAPARIAYYCQDKGWRVGGLINNAGLGWQQTFTDTNEKTVADMLRVNVQALTLLSRIFLKEMVEQKKGFILNVASTAAFQAVPYFAVYAATKAFVLSLSEALHEEAKKHGVLVCALCPGPVATEFQQVAGMEPRFFAHSQSVDEVVTAGFTLLRRKSAVGWTSVFQRFFSLGSDLSPRFLRRKLAGAIMKMAGAK